MVKIATFNTCLAVCPPLRFNGAFTRANHIVESIYALPDGRDIDVICMQELVVSREKILADFSSHPYHTGKINSGIFSDNIRFLHSGLCIVSKWPIVEESFHVFTGPSYHMEKFMSKAVQYAIISVENQFDIHVFNTHTQAWTNELSNQVRENQFKQIQQFKTKLDIPVSQPVFLAGDYNIDGYGDIITKMMSRTQMTLHYPEKSEFSFDPTVNHLVGNDDASEYKTILFPNGCYKEYLETGICECCPRQLIDGVATSNVHLQPTSVKIQVMQNKSLQDMDFNINIFKKRTTRNVSDHFLVLGEFKFDTLDNACCTFALPLQKKRVPFQSQYSPTWMTVEFCLFIVVYAFLLFTIYRLIRLREKKKS